MPKIDKNLIRTLCYIMLTTLPSIFTGAFYNGFTYEQLSSSNNASIKALGHSLDKQLQQLTSSMYYTLDLMTDSDVFETLNIPDISRNISLFTHYNPRACSNIYIVDKDFKTLYGVDDSTISGITYTDHIKTTFNGRSQTYYTATPSPFAQLTFPIFSPDNHTDVIAVLVATIDMNLFHQALLGLSDIDSNYKGYIIGLSGEVLATSLPPTCAIPSTINIEEIRMSLKYSEDQTFTDYNGDLMYGAVFELSNIRSYLLLSTPVSNISTTYLDYVSYIFGLLGAGSITTLEVIRKRRSAPSTSSSDVPPTEPANTDINTLSQVLADLDVYKDINQNNK